MQGRFDGMAVEVYDGKFAGGFDLPEDIGEAATFDTTVVFVVTGIAGKSTFDVTKSGDVKRTTQFDLHDVVALDPDLAVKVLNLVNSDGEAVGVPQQVPGQLAADFDDGDEYEDAELVDGPAVVGEVRGTSDEALADFLGVG